MHKEVRIYWKTEDEHSLLLAWRLRVIHPRQQHFKSSGLAGYWVSTSSLDEMPGCQCPAIWGQPKCVSGNHQMTPERGGLAKKKKVGTRNIPDEKHELVVRVLAQVPIIFQRGD